MTTRERFGLWAAIGIAGLATIAGCAATEKPPIHSGEAATDNPPPPSAETAAAPEQLSVPTIQAVVQGSFDRLRACYEEGLARDPKLAGRVVVQFVIANSGRVQSPEVVEGPPGQVADLRDQPVLDCILEAYRGIVFPAFASGEMTVAYPIVFSPDVPETNASRE